MSTDLAGTSAWRYWLARATDETENSRAAEPIYRSLLKDDNFYSAMASARLGERITPQLIQHAPNAATIEAIAELPPFRRAHELLLAGLPTEARREWNYGYTMLAAAPSEQAMHLASSWGRHDWSVETATAHGVFFDYPLLYPHVHLALASRAADDADIAAELVLAVMRQESLFDSSAVSSADAIGLMQLQPATATRAAQRIGLSIPGREELLDPAVNIRLGAAQIRALLNEFDDQLGPALAGYNAGYNAAARWLPDAPIALDVWIENIPYNETRAYVRRVLWHSLVYRWLESDRAQSSRDWLTDVRRP
jgi:soluble lytic murein transglycosylase